MDVRTRRSLTQPTCGRVGDCAQLLYFPPATKKPHEDTLTPSQWGSLHIAGKVHGMGDPLQHQEVQVVVCGGWHPDVAHRAHNNFFIAATTTMATIGLA